MTINTPYTVNENAKVVISTLNPDKLNHIEIKS